MALQGLDQYARLYGSGGGTGPQVGQTIGRSLRNMPGRRAGKATASYWQIKDSVMDPQITVGEDGILSINAADFKQNTLTDDWNEYKKYMKGRFVKLPDNAYEAYAQTWKAKTQEYGNNIANKFAVLNKRGISTSKLRELVQSSPELYQGLSQMGYLMPEVGAITDTYLQAGQGFFPGLREKIGPAAMAGASPLFGMYATGKGIYEGAKAKSFTAGGKAFLKAMPFQQGGRLGTGIGKGAATAKALQAGGKGAEWGSSKIIKEAGKKYGGTYATGGRASEGTLKSARNSITKARTSIDNLYVKNKLPTLKKNAKGVWEVTGGTLKKGKTAKDVTKAQAALRKANTLFKKVPKMTGAGNPVKMITRIVKDQGISGLRKLLVKSGASKAMITKMIARLTVGTALTGSGVGTAIGVGMNAWLAYDVWNLIKNVVTEDMPSSYLPGELMFGKKAEGLKGTTL